MNANNCTGYPYSKHDNKKCFESHGEHFDRKLGKKLPCRNTSEHRSDTAFLSWSGKTPHLPISLQTDSYKQYVLETSKDTSNYRRYPKQHHHNDDITNNRLSLSTCNYKYSYDSEELTPIPTKVLAVTQRNDKGECLWRYSKQSAAITKPPLYLTN